MQVPCKGCTERTGICHGHCTRYAEFRLANEQRRQAERNATYDIYWEYHHEKVKRR